MKYYKRGEPINAELHNVGKSPSFSVLNKARGNLLHHAIYNRTRELLNYCGTPETRDEAPYSLSGDYNCNMYIFFPVRGQTGDKIKVGFNMSTWDNYDATATCDFSWDGVASDNLINTKVTASSRQEVSNTYEGYTSPKGITVTDEKELDYDHNDIGGYGFTKIYFKHLIPAAFTSWIRPIDEADYSAIDTKYGAQSFGMSESAFNINQTLRGSSSYNDSNGSIGALCQRQFDDNNDGSNMVSNSELCLFQWGHPSGVFVSGGGTSLNDQDVFPYAIKFAGRELIESSTGYFDMAVVYRADAGTVLKVYVASTSTTHTYNLTTSTGTTPQTEVVLTGIPFDGSGDDITISCSVSDSLGVEIKTIAIFESTY